MGILDTIVVQPIFNLLMVLYGLVPGGDFGVALILFTIIIRLLLWPLVKKQLHQAKVMRAMQPEMLKLNKKYKKDRQARAMALMQLHKKHGVKPLSSILVLLIQLPILIGIFRVVQIFATDRGLLAQYTYGIVGHIPGVRALLEQPDSFNQQFLGIMDLTQRAVGGGQVVISLLIVAASASLLQYLLSKQLSPQQAGQRRLRDVLAEAGQGKEADQMEVNAIMMQKMMKVMPVMMFLVAISLPGALALYMMVGNVVAYMQNAMIMKQQAAEAPLAPLRPAQPSRANKPERTTAESRVTRITAKDNGRKV